MAANTNAVALFRKQTHLITVKESLDILRDVSGLVPIFGPQLSALVGVVHNVVGIMQGHHRHRKSHDDLAKRLTRTLNIIISALKELDVGNTGSDDPKLRNDLNELERIIRRINQHFEEHYSKGRIDRAVIAFKEDARDRNKHFSEELDVALRHFNFSSCIDMRLALKRVEDMLSFKFAEECARRTQCYQSQEDVGSALSSEDEIAQPVARRRQDDAIGNVRGIPNGPPPSYPGVPTGPQTGNIPLSIILNVNVRIDNSPAQAGDGDKTASVLDSVKQALQDIMPSDVSSSANQLTGETGEDVHRDPDVKLRPGTPAPTCQAQIICD